MSITISQDLWGRENEAKLGRVFSWLARSGIGRRVGSVPIGWYQQHQVAAIELLEQLAGEKLGLPPKASFQVREAKGDVFARSMTSQWVRLGSTREMFTLVDRALTGT